MLVGESSSSMSDPCRCTSTLRFAGSISHASVVPPAMYSAILSSSAVIASVGERSSTSGRWRERSPQNVVSGQSRPLFTGMRRRGHGRAPAG